MSLLTTLALAAALNGPVVTVVRVPTPWYAPRAWIAHKMRATQPQYAALPGLQFKAYSFELASGDFGGVYLWRSRQDAEAWFSPAWHERVQRDRGVKGDVQILDLPALPPRAQWPAASEHSPLHIAWVPGLSQAPTADGLLLAVPTPTGQLLFWRDADTLAAWRAGHAGAVTAFAAPIVLHASTP